MKRQFNLACLASILFGVLAPTLCLGADRGERIDAQYRETLAAAESAQKSGHPSRALSEIYRIGAGKCRDLGGTETTLSLYAAAVEVDPQNANAHREYGDYLMGYRGLYELASEQYYAALDIVRSHPDVYGDEFKQALERSLQIMHRDGGDGAPLITTKHFSLFIDGAIGYREFAPPIISVSAGDGSLLTQETRLNAYIDTVRQPELEGSINSLNTAILENQKGKAFFNQAVHANNEGLEFFGDKLNSNVEGITFFNNLVAMNPAHPDAPEWQAASDALAAEAAVNAERVSEIQGDKRSNQSKIGDIQSDQKGNEAALAQAEKDLSSLDTLRKQVPKYLTRRPQQHFYEGGVLLRFGGSQVPYVKFSWEKTEQAEGEINLANLDQPLDVNFERYAVTLGRNYRMPHGLDLLLEGEVAETELTFENPAIDLRIAQEESVQYIGRAAVTKNMGFNTVRLNLDGTFADIENDSSKHDSSYTGNISLRLSSFPTDIQVNNSERFKGRRSTHWEGGMRYSERDFKAPGLPTVTEEVVRPFISYEELGLVSGWLDLSLFYAWTEDKVSGGLGKGTFEGHTIGVMPTFIPVYRLYDSDFWSGLEHLTIGFPVTVNLDEGHLDRYTFASKVFARYVTRYGVAIHPTLSFDYAYYPEIEDDDWGIFAQCAFSSGAKRNLRGTKVASR